jgi:hypothetical protein
VQQRARDLVLPQPRGHGLDRGPLADEHRRMACGVGGVTFLLGGFRLPRAGIDDDDRVTDAQDVGVRGPADVEVLGVVAGLPVTPRLEQGRAGRGHELAGAGRRQ